MDYTTSVLSFLFDAFKNIIRPTVLLYFLWNLIDKIFYQNYVFFKS